MENLLLKKRREGTNGEYDANNRRNKEARGWGTVKGG